MVSMAMLNPQRNRGLPQLPGLSHSLPPASLWKYWWEWPKITTLTSSFSTRGKAVEGAPTFEELWPRLDPVFSSGVLTAHNAPFDMSVLAKSLRAYCVAPSRRWR